MTEVYRVKSKFGFEFVKIEAEKVTEQSVFIQGTRQAKQSDGVRYFEDFESARQYAMAQLNRQAERAQKELNAANDWIEHMKSIDKDTMPIATRKW